MYTSWQRNESLTALDLYTTRYWRSADSNAIPSRCFFRYVRSTKKFTDCPVNPGKPFQDTNRNSLMESLTPGLNISNNAVTSDALQNSV